MYVTKLTPRFHDTDTLGHINHAVFATWFEQARRPIFKIFTPDLDTSNWKIILAKLEIEYLDQCYYQHEVEVRTHVPRIGKSSFDVVHEVWQSGKCVTKGKVVLIHFDYNSQKSKALSETEKSALAAL